MLMRSKGCTKRHHPRHPAQIAGKSQCLLRKKCEMTQGDEDKKKQDDKGKGKAEKKKKKHTHTRVERGKGQHRNSGKGHCVEMKSGAPPFFNLQYW
jgi:hypothetical protein